MTNGIPPKEALEAQTRPWVGVVGIPEIESESESVAHIQYANDSTVKNVDYIQLSIKLQNFGQSPAVQLAYRFKTFWVIAPKIDYRETSGLCDPPVKDQVFTTPVDSIFPGSDAALQKKNIIVASDPVPVTDVREPNYLFGCVTYRRSGFPRIYWTYVVYSLDREQRPSSDTDPHRRIISVKTIETESQ